VGRAPVGGVPVPYTTPTKNVGFITVNKPASRAAVCAAIYKYVNIYLGELIMAV